MFYFAYGSNLCFNRIHQRVPGVSRVGVARLDEHQLRFHMAADDGSSKADAFFTGRRGDHVWGVLYTIPEEQKPILDRFESLGVGYEIRKVRVQLTSEVWSDAWVYIALHLDPARKPYDWYLAHVVRGAEQNGFPAAYLERLRRTPSLEDANQARSKKEWDVEHYRLCKSE